MQRDVAADVGRVASGLGLSLTEAQAAQLGQFLALLQRWNTTYNLTAVRDPDAMLTQHLADCLAVAGPLQRWISGHPGVRSVLDVGSGGGLPGVVLAIAMPGLDVTCVDTVGKKAAFIRQVAAELALKNLHAAHARVEAMEAGGFDLVISRAFAALPDFTSLTAGRLHDGGVWVAMKGKQPDAEMAALPAGIEVFHVEPLKVPGLDAERCLVWMKPARGPSPPPARIPR